MSLAGRLVGRLMPSLSARAARPAPGIVRRGMASYTEQMEKTGRPLSPHVTIYAFPTIALSSITVRATGILLTVGAPPPPGTASSLEAPAGLKGVGWRGQLSRERMSLSLGTREGVGDGGR